MFFKLLIGSVVDVLGGEKTMTSENPFERSFMSFTSVNQFHVPKEQRGRWAISNLLS
ncbi:hypothetical protein KSC_078220 [Ktedonobacter sp. SOSP1-52]|nr:hypothetical protein KSC_078220 [Ktedonobacter sp. SOSP1-52]